MIEKSYICEGCGSVIKSENGILSSKCPVCDRKRVSDSELIEYDNTRKQVIIMAKFSPVPFAEEITKNNKFIYDKHKRFWRYNNIEGIWEAGAENIIKSILRVNLFGDEQQKRNYVQEVVAYIQESNYNENFKPNADPYLIAFKNKVFNLKKDIWEDFSPEHYLTNKLNIEIDENIKECPKIDKFFCDSIGEKYKDILYDLPAYCLYRGMPYQKIFFVFGYAGTGKSQYMSLIENFLGDNNSCSFEPNDIQKDPYASGQMLYKLANIASDINYDSLNNVSQIKKLSGGDTMKIRVMYKEPFNEKINCKQIFSTNKMPEVKEKTNAWYRRMYPIEFNNIVSKDKRDPFILEAMTSEKELKGFAYKCIEKLRELRDNKFIFTWDIDEEKIKEVYEELSNPVIKFVKGNCLDKKGESSFWVYQFEFKERLNNWLDANHYPIMTSSQINEYMKDNYNTSNRANLRGDGTYRVWVGVKWDNLLDSSHLNHFNHFNGVKEKVYSSRKGVSKGLKTVKSVKLLNDEKTTKFTTQSQ